MIKTKENTQYQSAEPLKGVSILELLGKKLSGALILLAVFLSISAHVYPRPGHSILDAVDPGFNAQIETNSFFGKFVHKIIALPNGKILASGIFNSYNRQPVGTLIRLNPDGSLDTTFNNNLFGVDDYPVFMLVQADGRIIVGNNIFPAGQSTPVLSLKRLTEDGDIDPSFDYQTGGILGSFCFDQNEKLLLVGVFNVNINGNDVPRELIRINQDGSFDPSFDFTFDMDINRVVAQNDKIIVTGADPALNAHAVYRFNSDGSVDTTFSGTFFEHFFVRGLVVQPDKKILLMNETQIHRINENGGLDPGFQSSSFQGPARGLHLAADGRITIANGSSLIQIRRLLSDGTPDSGFATYDAVDFGCFDVQPDGKVVVGDSAAVITGTQVPNHFVRLLENGSVDPNFNVGGIGFQSMTPGSIWSIDIQPDDKILIAGKFDTVNQISRPKMARLNPDSSLDSSFQLSVSGPGDRFTSINSIYYVKTQPDGKIIVSGNFVYTLNGTTKANLVRLDPDGSIDPTFVLNFNIANLYDVNLAGRNKPLLLGNSQILIGSSRAQSTGSPTIPTRVNSNGTLDTSFNPNFFGGHDLIYIYDIAVQPDGKILIGGKWHDPGGSPQNSFMARLNADGSTDQTFQISQTLNQQISAFLLLENGKILIAKGSYPILNAAQSDVQRLNSDGTPDNTFNAGTGVDGAVNAMVILPTGKVLLGGRFTEYDGSARANLALINPDGSLDKTTYNVNHEVLCMTLDKDGRLLIGGNFTTINVDGGEQFTRSFVARLVDRSHLGSLRFDFDGDGKSDYAVYNPDNRVWSIFQSGNDTVAEVQFGLDGDKLAPADYDGDGKADIAVYRPSTGIWYTLKSTEGFAAYRWGLPEDKPVPADYDGDGKADIAVYRPSEGNWYILQSSNLQLKALHFGLSGDIPLQSTDFDADGIADVAVWRPSEGIWYWLPSSLPAGQFRAVKFGQNGDIPVAADFNGDLKTDLVIYRPSEGIWYQYLSTSTESFTFAAVRFGQNGDVPVTADYNGDGKADIAIRRQNLWHVLMSGETYVVSTFGSGTDTAVAGFDSQ
ncbi:MAG: FG-GAP-like repeat-containing protein [Pyrinomonadaceae bacterium]